MENQKQKTQVKILITDFAGPQRQATAARTVAYLRTLQRQLTGVEVTEKGLRPAVDPKTGNVTFPDTEAYGEFLDSESWYVSVLFLPGKSSICLQSIGHDCVCAYFVLVHMCIHVHA